MFDFIGSGHPFFPQIASLREAIAKDPPEMAVNSAAKRSLLRLDLSETTPKLKWAYVSRQSWTNVPGRFEAVTYLQRVDRMRVNRYEFPRDPKLTGLAKVLNGFPIEWNVLRYVPRRRLTVKTGGRIAKFVRPSELTETLARLKVVEGIFRKNAGFVAPMVTESQVEASLFFEEIVAGTGLPSLINTANFPVFLETAGKLCRRIHRRDAATASELGRESLLTTAARDEALLMTFRPDLKLWLAAVLNELTTRMKSFPAEAVFCHGDFRAAHVLATNAGDWGIVDFDGAVAADPHWELALFITSLKRELTIFEDAGLHEQAADAYLAGYEKEGGRVNRDRLRCFRLASEIHFLARSFQRDLYTPRLFAQSVREIGSLSGIGMP